MILSISVETEDILPQGFEKVLNDICQKTAEYHNKTKEYENAEVSLVLCDSQEITNLNKNYRGIDKETDVLSFPMDEDEGFLSPEEYMLGDIAICVSRMISQAEEYGHSRERELSFLFLHGLLHLLGYDHIKDEERALMEKVQREILEELNITR